MPLNMYIYIARERLKAKEQQKKCRGMGLPGSKRTIRRYSSLGFICSQDPKPRGSLYTTIMELGTKRPSIMGFGT